MPTIYMCCHCGTELENQCWCPKCKKEVEDYDEEELEEWDEDDSWVHDHDMGSRG